MSRIITLTNGKRVGNFSSPHNFYYVDGSILPAVDNLTAKRLEVDFIENVMNSAGDVALTFKLSTAVITEMERWYLAKSLEEVDVVICALPMIVAIREKFGMDWLLKSPFRAVRIEDRIKKLCSIEKQCI